MLPSGKSKKKVPDITCQTPEKKHRGRLAFDGDLANSAGDGAGHANVTGNGGYDGGQGYGRGQQRGTDGCQGQADVAQLHEEGGRIGIGTSYQGEPVDFLLFHGDLNFKGEQWAGSFVMSSHTGFSWVLILKTRRINLLKARAEAVPLPGAVSSLTGAMHPFNCRAASLARCTRIRVRSGTPFTIR